MPPGGAFHTQAEPPASASIPGGQAGRFKGLGLECQSWPCCLHQGTLAPTSLTGPQPLGRHRVLQRQVDYNYGQASTDIQGTQTKGSAKECFQGQLASSSAQGLSAPQLRARNPSNRQHLPAPWQSKKLPTLLKDFQHFIFLLSGCSQPEEQGIVTRGHTAGERGVNEGHGMEGSGASSLGARVKGG